MITRLSHSILQYTLILALGLLAACGLETPDIENDNRQNEIRISTVYSPTTYFIDTENETGFEYELARLFADTFDHKLKMIVASNKAEMIDLLLSGEVDIATGLLKETFENNPKLTTGPDYFSVSQQVIYKLGIDRPGNLDDLYPYQLHIARGGLRVDKLDYIKKQFPDFSWMLHPEMNASEIIDMVHREEIAYAAVYSNELITAQQKYPDLRVAFDLSAPTHLSWIINKSNKNDLQEKIQTFFEKIEFDESLAELIEYFYGPVQKFDYVDQRRFIDRFSNRLPKFEPIFKAAANELEIDWRFLAAMSYQESHWNERARSPTGVRGLMMLTLDTAKQVGITNRLDPEQSIMGGAKYIKHLISRIPDRIEEPDRTWFALAAYNLGMGHLEDARIITEKNGMNPDKWQDVKSNLPYLQNSQWYKQTNYGYARGNEAVNYVESIRKYYNTIIQLTHEEPETQELILPRPRMIKLPTLSM